MSLRERNEALRDIERGLETLRRLDRSSALERERVPLDGEVWVSHPKRNSPGEFMGHRYRVRRGLHGGVQLRDDQGRPILLLMPDYSGEAP